MSSRLGDVTLRTMSLSWTDISLHDTRWACLCLNSHRRCGLPPLFLMLRTFEMLISTSRQFINNSSPSIHKHCKMDLILRIANQTFSPVIRKQRTTEQRRYLPGKDAAKGSLIKHVVWPLAAGAAQGSELVGVGRRVSAH